MPWYKDERILNRVAIVLSIVVFLLVGLMRQVKIDLGVDFHFLPPIHASINALLAIVLLVALWHIKRRNIDAHRRAIFVAMGLSALFLLSYVLYHFTTEETTFCKEGLIRKVYYFFLITHITLAGISLPFILFTFIRGFTRQDARHKKLAKWVFPVWLYVAITGPLVYVLLYPCY